jgi:hypothetical protein
LHHHLKTPLASQRRQLKTSQLLPQAFGTSACEFFVARQQTTATRPSSSSLDAEGQDTPAGDLESTAAADADSIPASSVGMLSTELSAAASASSSLCVSAAAPPPSNTSYQSQTAIPDPSQTANPHGESGHFLQVSIQVIADSCSLLRAHLNTNKSSQLLSTQTNHLNC